jgi:hypothetical protein
MNNDPEEALGRLRQMLPERNAFFRTNMETLIQFVGDLAARGPDYQGAWVGMGDLGSSANWLVRQLKFVRLTRGEYARLLEDNINHFAPVAQWDYASHHERAMELAYEAGREADSEKWKHAFEVEGMGAHFLTDLFSAGHVRTPRIELAHVCSPGRPYSDRDISGDLRIAAMLAGLMHNEDGNLGVLLTGVGDGSWTAYGDASYFRLWAADNLPRIAISLGEALDSLLYRFLEGLGHRPREEHPVSIPEPLPLERQLHPPMFRVQRGDATGVKVGKDLSVRLRTTPADRRNAVGTYARHYDDFSGDPVEYEVFLDDTCEPRDQLNQLGTCMTCNDAMRGLAKAHFDESGKVRAARFG